MPNVYERAHADGSPVWSDWTGYGTAWNHVEDELRFHKGGGFTITNRDTNQTGPVRKLAELEPLVKNQLDDAHEKTVIEIRSVKDNFAMIMRRDHTQPDLGHQLVKWAEALIPLPYEIGWVVSAGKTDCSGLTMFLWNKAGVDNIPHNAEQQSWMFGKRAGFLKISRAQLQIGDPVYIDEIGGVIHHVATYAGIIDGHPSVIDTEPSNTGSPAGWPYGTELGTGVRYRPMDGNYYCSKVVFFGRIVEINGKP